MTSQEKFMSLAIREAKKAQLNNEVPIGAIVVKGDKVISRAYNKRNTTQIATDHAEIMAIEKACKKLNSWRLDDCELYVTLEPCIMCAGAICNSRIKKVYFGAYESKSGAIESKYNVLKDNGLNYVGEYVGGIKQDECSKMLKDFFKNCRNV